MAKKLSLILLSDSGSSITRFQLSRHHLIGLSILLIFSIVALTFGLYDYFFLQSKLADMHGVELQLSHKSDEVILQRRQIQQFAKEINELKKRLQKLNEFEEKIRIIANIGKSGNPDGLFGVGGSAPEDLDISLELTQKHHQLMRDIHQQIEQINDASTYQKTSLENLLTKMEEQKNVLAHTPAIRPARGWVTSRFEYRKSPFTNKREFHKGLDIANRKGTPIIATADGVVSFVGQNGAFGQTLVIDHGYGIVTRYAHLDKELKKRGDRVQRGEQIALMGNSGRSTGPHLHYEIRLNGVPINPETYILN